MYREIKTFEDLPKIVAVDFDGTLVTDEWPKIGKPNEPLIEFLKYIRDNQGVKLILWTSRNYSLKYGDLLEEAVNFCSYTLGLEFDAINENLREVQILTGEDTRKIYADIYLDDKSISAFQAPIYWVDKLGIEWMDVIDWRTGYAKRGNYSTADIRLD